MARYIYQGTWKDGNGKVVTSGTVSVFLAGTATVASVYAAEVGGGAVNSVTSDSTDGTFEFWVDDSDYAATQKFKITLSKANFRSKSYDDLDVIDGYIKVDSIAQLRLSEGKVKQVAVLSGYYTPGDGGSGQFYWDSTSTDIDNGGTIIKVTAVTTGRWIRLESGRINIRWFGANPSQAEGVNDTAIQAALDSISSGLVYGPVGLYPVSATFLIPNFVSLIGEQMGIATNPAFTLLYSGTGECLRSVGVQDVVPFIGTRIEDIQIRKTTQASTLAAIAMISGGGVHIKNVRIDTDNAGYNFAYGIVLDQTEVGSVSQVDIQAPSDTGIWLINGADYTVGNSINFTNVITLSDININGAGVCGIAHDGGATFALTGTNNFNACPIGVYIGALSNFAMDGCLFEAGTGQADIYISQYKKDLVTSVGGCSSGKIQNNRTSGSTTNCIYVRGPGSQTTAIDIRSNRFGSARSGSAIGLSDSDALQSSIIGANDNLGGSGKDYLDEGVYLYNTVLAVPNAVQQEQKRMVTMPGLVSTYRSGVEKAVTFTSSSTYNVDDEDEFIHCNTTSNNVTIMLPDPGTNGRTITGLLKTGGNNVIFDAGVGNTVSRSGTAAQTRTITTLGEAWTLQCEGSATLNWFVISTST